MRLIPMLFRPTCKKSYKREDSTKSHPLGSRWELMGRGRRLLGRERAVESEGPVPISGASSSDGALAREVGGHFF